MTELPRNAYVRTLYRLTTQCTPTVTETRGAGWVSGRATDSIVIRPWVRVPAGVAGEFLLQGQLSVLTRISVSVSPPF